MDLLKAPSIQSLLDSDIDSIASLQSLDIDELDEEEYALPQSEIPTLAEALSEDDGDIQCPERFVQEPIVCAALQAEVLQGVSQQLTQAQERTQAGAATTLSAGPDGRLSVGTSHGNLLTFVDQVLRWACDSNTDRGAISSLAYNHDGSRLLAGFARGTVCQYETSRGVVLRRIALGGELWGVLRVLWAGTTGLALDTGGSVWLMKFSRPLGVRASRSSCLFSGARGEVVAVAARDARVLALATLARVIVVAGGRAAGVRSGGPPHALPVVTWAGTDDRLLVTARHLHMQFLAAIVTPESVSLKPLQRFDLTAAPLWLGWLGTGLAILDSHEKLYMWGNDGEKPLDLSDIEPVYATAFFKGVWTEGRVSLGMSSAGASALGGVCAAPTALHVLGRRGVLRIRPRDVPARARALLHAGRTAKALQLLANAGAHTEPGALPQEFVAYVLDRHALVNDKEIARNLIKLCVKFGLKEELWGQVWETCVYSDQFVEAVAEAAAREELAGLEPTPDITQALVERMADVSPSLLEGMLVSFPLTALDPHACSTLLRARGLWRALGAVAAALGGTTGAMRELCEFVGAECGAGCGCAGDALLVCVADGLGGRAAGGGELPAHARPAARHDALHALLTTGSGAGGRSPLGALAGHGARALCRLLEQCSRDPPFVGPLGKQNRLRVARELLAALNILNMKENHLDIIEFVANQIVSGSLPCDTSLLITLIDLAVNIDHPRADRVLLSLLKRTTAREQVNQRVENPKPRLAFKLHSNEPKVALKKFFEIQNIDETDVDDLYSYIQTLIAENKLEEIAEFVLPVSELRPGAASAVLLKNAPQYLPAIFDKGSDECIVKFGEHLLEAGHLTGNLAVVYLKSLCKVSPDSVVGLLSAHPGVVSPEEALRIVRECGVSGAEAYCLEMCGDPLGALHALLSGAPGEEAVRAACELCARAGRTAPPDVVASMWAKVLSRAESVPAWVMAEAASFVPPHVLFGDRVWGDSVTMRDIVHCVQTRLALWEGAAALTRTEIHVALARALRDAGRGRRGQAEGAGATYPTTLRPRDQNLEHATTDLVLVAPPRPDLEGIV